MAKGRGRPRKSKEQKLKDALERTAPNARVIERQRLFSGLDRGKPVQYVIAPTGELRPVEQSYDAIGQMWLLDMLEGHGHDSVELRDKARFWGGHYAKLMKGSAVKVSSYERKDRTSGHANALTGADLMFDRMDENLPSYERVILLSLLVDPLIGHGDTVPWAQSLIDEALLQRKRLPEGRVMRFPDMDDRYKLEACIRGLCVLVDGSLPARWAA
jgi:hypothetical protein